MQREKNPVIIDVTKLTVSQCRKAYNELATEYKKIFEDKLYCHHCGQFRPKSNFYKSYKTTSGVIPTCKKCLYVIATNYDENSRGVNVTEESVKAALKLADLPFIKTLYETGMAEVSNEASGKAKTNIWTSMIKNIQSLPQYYGMGWDDSDIDNSSSAISSNTNDEFSSEKSEINETYEANKKTVFMALGYDPFTTASEEDRPLMYSKLAGMLDESTNEDELKLGACVEITHDFMQSEKFNFVINDLQKTPDSIMKNASTIKSMTDTKNKIFTSMLALAKENGITINSSNKNTKGANTWTGVVKELKELKLREAEVNAFDIGTAEGMLQVAELSNAAILHQLSLDENDYTDMIKLQKGMIDDISSKMDATLETARLLQRENNDLKDFLKNKGLINSLDEVIS